MKRLNSIDIARALAIVLMIMCHFTIFMTRPEGAYPGTFFFGDHILGDFPAAMFLFLVGLCLSISVNQSKQNGMPESSILSRLIIRGAVVFIFGMIFGIIVWGYENTFDWDILTTIGSSIIIVAFLRNLSSRKLVIFAVAVMVLSPFLRNLWGYPAFWEEAEYTPPWTIKEILGGYFLNGYFPLFPWISFSIIGHAIGKMLFIEHDESIRLRNQKKIPVIGALMMITGFGGFLVNLYAGSSNKIMSFYISKLSFYPLSTTLFLVEGGFILLLFGLLHIRFDFEAIDNPVMNFLRRYSRYSLSVYVIHHVLIVFVPRMTGLIVHQEDYFYYQDMFEPPIGLLLSVIFIFAFFPILIIWDKVKGAGSFEWGVNKLVPKNRKSVP